MAKKRGGRKYGKKASQKVEKAMRERKRGHASQRRVRQEGHQPETGDRYRAVRGAPGGREGAPASAKGGAQEALDLPAKP